MKKFFMVLMAIALVGAFAGTTIAADWSFYGSARMETFSYDKSKEWLGGNYSDRDTAWALQGNARIGANVAAGDVTGRFEYGSGPNLRILYGEWNFGSGKLLVGQTYTPITSLLSNQAAFQDMGLLGVGEIYAGRKPMIQLTFGGFKLAFVTPNVGATYGTYTSDTDTVLPKIEASYRFATDMFWVKPYGGYQSYDMVNATDSSKDVTSFIVGAAAGVNVGPATIKANIYTASNMADYGAGYGAMPTNTAAAGAGVTPGMAAWSGTELKNDTEMGGLLLASAKFSDMVGVEAGFGYRSGEIDLSPKIEWTIMSYYVQVPITLADGVFIVPEFGKLDFDKVKQGGAEAKLGDQVYFGAKWQINF